MIAISYEFADVLAELIKNGWEVESRTEQAVNLVDSAGLKGCMETLDSGEAYLVTLERISWWNGRPNACIAPTWRVTPGRGCDLIGVKVIRAGDPMVAIYKLDGRR